MKLSEFPNHATYAQGFATDITFSEGIGFLTKSDPQANAAFIVTAHEAAHQWWGNLVVPGKGPGGNIVSEGMAHFSTILLCEQVKGLRQRIEFCKRIEESYGETPAQGLREAAGQDRRLAARRHHGHLRQGRLGLLDAAATHGPGTRVAGVARLHRPIPPESGSSGAPGLRRHDAAVRPDPEAYDAFVKQWFFEVVLPEYRLSEARLVQLHDTATAGAWEVTVRVKNAGTGRMAIEMAAAGGERFDKDGQVSADYHDARETVTLGAGESTDVTIRCDFKPDRVLVDPDALVFQLLRKLAVVELR